MLVMHVLLVRQWMLIVFLVRVSTYVCNVLMDIHW